MKDDCKRQFIQLSRAWYADANLRGGEVIDEIIIGFDHKDGGTTGEFAIRWIELSGSKSPMLCSFDDSWDALWQFRDAVEAMVAIDGTHPTPDEICRMLVSVGIEDNTPAVSPYGDRKADGRRLWRELDTANDARGTVFLHANEKANWQPSPMKVNDDGV